MLNYTNKGPGLIAQLAAAHVGFRFEGGQAVAHNEPVAQQVIDGYTLQMCKLHKQMEIAHYAREIRNEAMAHLSPWEGAAWPHKIVEAAAYLASNPLDPSLAPSLLEEAKHRQITLDQLLLKISSNAGPFKQMEAWIAGIDGYHRDRIEEKQNFAEVLAYDFHSGWPAL